MFLDQIKAPKMAGVVHVCDSKSIDGDADRMNLYLKCSVCGAIDFCSFPSFLPPDEVSFNLGQDEFLEKYRACTGDFRTDEEVEREMKSLWQRIKG